MIILCHKDGGVLQSDAPSEAEGLYGCGCISGWVRGFEPLLSREAAIKEQVAETQRWIDLYVGQGRDESYIWPLLKRRAGLEVLK